MPNKYLIDEPDDSSWDLNQERAFWEKMLNQKINFFLAFFVILIVGAAVANTKELTLFVLSVGAIILWVLSVSIINTTRKINYAVKELSKSSKNSTGLVDRKAKGRLVRLVVGFGLPVFCASVVTLVFLAGLSGLYSFNFSSKPEIIQSVQSTIEKGKESIVNKTKPVQDNSKYFENVDSIIKQNKSLQISIPLDTVNAVAKKQNAKKQIKINPEFKNIDRIISGTDNYSAPVQSSTKKSKRLGKSSILPNETNSATTEIENSEFAKPIVPITPIQPPKQKATQSNTPRKVQKNDPNFKSIEKVISQ